MISDRAPACVGCGAPLAKPSPEELPFNLEPEPDATPALTHPQLRRRMHMAGVTFIAGMLSVGYSAAHPDNKPVATGAALLVTCGLCWLIVAIVQNVMARKRPQP
ncbi:MAG TPA: hypothetical protein VHZ99_00850 [Steroidobacteraceae bacterium]|jgi:hypothetical protein|nr:hypothetical protein [Steroidobacteraceae bacterium]